jgi:isochorismate synthase
MDPGQALAAAIGSVAGRGTATLVAVVMPVAGVDPVALFAAAEAAGHERALWLRPEEGVAFLGVGAAWSWRAAGPQRFAAIDAAWRDLTSGAVVEGDGPRGSGPLLLGGYGFADAPATTATWQGFETARVVLPELLLTVTPEGSWLTGSQVVAPGPSAGKAAQGLARAWHELCQGAALHVRSDGGRAEPARQALRLIASRPGAAEWRASVARMAGAVGRGRLDKVVLARQVDLEARSPIAIPAVLERLRARATGSTVFAIGSAGRTFLGASPERLVRLEGRHLVSVAMAGSIRRGADRAEDDRLAAELLASDKEREEHAVVVDMLRATLAPLTDELAIPARPHVERLRHLQHLVTPVEGRLRERSSVLRLAELLHPTPAVGGMPRDLALELIAEEEAHERGWYAAPLGWIDRAGDGELVVALRSGVVEGARATLLAGCGIVADSDPEREWQESTTKLLALGSALGRVDA